MNEQRPSNTLLFQLRRVAQSNGYYDHIAPFDAEIERLQRELDELIADSTQFREWATPQLELLGRVTAEPTAQASKEYLPRVDRLTVARVIDGSGTQSERSAVWNYICGLERTLAERSAPDPLPPAPMSDAELRALCKQFVVEGYNGDYLENDGFDLAREVEELTLKKFRPAHEPAAAPEFELSCAMCVHNKDLPDEDDWVCSTCYRELISELRASEPPPWTEAYNLLADDAYAATFQSLGQYRAAVLGVLRGKQPSEPPAVVQDMEKIAWCQKVHEDLAMYVDDGGGQMIHVRAKRALGIMFDEMQKLEKALYPSLTKPEVQK